MDKLNALAMFVATAETGSFSRGAERLGKTPSALTKAVAHLEAELGARLFERTTRSLALTEAGQIYLEAARQSLETLRTAGRRSNCWSRSCAANCASPRRRRSPRRSSSRPAPASRGASADQPAGGPRRNLPRSQRRRLRPRPARRPHRPAGAGGAAAGAEPDRALRQPRLPGAATRAARPGGLRAARLAGLPAPFAEPELLVDGARRRPPAYRPAAPATGQRQLRLPARPPAGRAGPAVLPAVERRAAAR